MLYNVFLACIPIILIHVAVQIKPIGIRLFFLLLWLIFLPNTLYLLTDETHLSDSLANTPTPFVPLTLLFFLLLFILGIITFILALSPLERFLQKTKSIHTSAIFLSILLINILVGFGIILGRVERANSWDIFLHPLVLVWNIYALLLSPNLLGASFIWGISANLLYFSLRNWITKIMWNDTIHTRKTKTSKTRR